MQDFFNRLATQAHEIAAAGQRKAHGVCRPGRDKLSERKVSKIFCPTFCVLQKVGQKCYRWTAKGFNWIVRDCYLCALIRGLQNLESPLEKVLSLLVGSCCLGGLLRGLENLESPCEGERIVTFFGVQKVPQKHAEGCGPLDSRGRFKSPLDS